jgi:hypothetical protein
MRAAVLVALLFLPVFQEGEPEIDDPKFKKVLPLKDTTDDIIKAYTDAKSLAPHSIAIHEEPKAGQYWEVGSDSFDITSSTRWQVSKVAGGRALIEQHLKMKAEMFKSDYVLGFRIELKPEAGKPQVTKAWIGKPGEKPQEITVRELPKNPTPKGDEPKGIAFTELELGGRKWDGKLYTDVTDDISTRIWVADGGWFNAIIKTTVDEEYEEKLQALGEDAKPILDWPQDVLD